MMNQSATTWESGLTVAENAVLERKVLERIEMQAWVANLAPWELAFTGTFRWEASLASGQRAFERFMKRRCSDVSYFYALEPNPSRDGCHVHSLFANTAGLYRKAIWQEWLSRFGRNRLEPIRHRVDAENYVAKYCTKDASWWNVHLADPMLKGLTKLPGVK